MQTLVWQTKEFIFYPEIFRVHLKDLEHGRDMAIFMVENYKSWHALQDLLGGGPTGWEVSAVVPRGCYEGLNQAWELGDLSHSCEVESTG